MERKAETLVFYRQAFYVAHRLAERSFEAHESGPFARRHLRAVLAALEALEPMAAGIRYPGNADTPTHVEYGATTDDGDGYMLRKLEERSFRARRDAGLPMPLYDI